MNQGFLPQQHLHLNHSSDEEHAHHDTLKTGKKRERATQACSPCRKKKKRCDGAKPNCKNCIEAGLDCTYAVCKRRGPRKGYVQLLEERLAMLERRLTNLPASPTSTSPTTATATVTDNSHSKLTALLEPSSNGLLDDVKMPSEDVVLHLVDFFFKYINSIFPLVHHATLVQSIKDGSISPPLLWSVMAIGARFSDHPDIKTDPPYWAGEKFARKAGSLISNDLFEPTVPNLQFWGVMACLEYGRAAGSRAWIYGGLAARLCFELGFHKEETLKLPVYKKDGTMDRVAMLMRRRIFWSCFNIDKYGSAGNSRPQFFNKGDYNVDLPDEESLALLNPLHQNVTVDYKPVKVDSLGSFIKHYLSLMELFGDVIKGLQRAKNNQNKAMWPPTDDFDQLNNELQAWKRDLPKHMDFTLEDLDYHLERASRGKINHYLCAHVIWCTLILALHRGSLAYVDPPPSSSSNNNNHNTRHPTFSPQMWEHIQYSVSMCKQVVHDVMPIFESMKNICGVNVIPYMGYSSYMFATILMTSTFTNTEAEHRKGTKGLLLLYDMIELLRPYWPVCERLSVTTRDLIVSHSRMYEYSQEEHYKRTGYELPLSPRLRPFQSYSTSSSASIASPSSTTRTSASTLSHQQSIPVSMTNLLNSHDAIKEEGSLGYPTYSLSTIPTSQPQQQQHQQHHQQPPPPLIQSSFSSSMPTPSSLTSSTLLSNSLEMGGPPFVNSGAAPDSYSSSGAIDFNSSAFLYDTGLFGQLMFDETKLMNDPSFYGLQQQQQQQQQQQPLQQQPMAYPQNNNSRVLSTSSPTNSSPTSYMQPSPSAASPILDYGKRTWDPVWR